MSGQKTRDGRDGAISSNKQIVSTFEAGIFKGTMKRHGIGSVRGVGAREQDVKSEYAVGSLCSFGQRISGSTGETSVFRSPMTLSDDIEVTSA